MKGKKHVDGKQNGTEIGTNNGKEKPSNDKKPPQTPIPYKQLFRYAGWKEYILMVIGTIGALGHSVGFPMLFLLLGDMTNNLIDFGRLVNCGSSLPPTNGSLEFNSSIAFNVTESRLKAAAAFRQAFEIFEQTGLELIYTFLGVGAAVFVAASLQTACWSLQATSISAKIRHNYFRSLLGQDISYHDINSAEELSTKLIDGIAKIEEGIGAKVGNTIQYISQVIVLLVIAFQSTWKVTIVNVAVVPLLAGTMIFLTKMTQRFSIQEELEYLEAGTIAEEAISSIRTVVAFGCQENEVKNYGAHLGIAKKVGIKKEALKGLSPGVIRVILFGMYGLTFWFGGTLVLEREIAAGNFLTSFFCIIFSAVCLSSLGGVVAYFAEAKTAGASVYEVIDRKPEIDALSEKGTKPDDMSSHIEMNNVCFHYPTRPSVEVAKSISLKVQPGCTVALVGQSGSGKSTIVQLLQRFYDIQSGLISIGGHDIKSLNVHWLRSQVGVVSQEPVLFATTIRENIRWGRIEATDEEVEEAAKQANAYDFIMKLTKRYDTLVGEKGAFLSGGQKQRIAIARAIIRKPKILLLDEATSALDSQSEKIVQDALEKVSSNHTTIVIAHRLSTIRNVDQIYAFKDGEVVEGGTHQALMQLEDGVYRKLVETQMSKETNDANQTREVLQENGEIQLEADNKETNEDMVEVEIKPKQGEKKDETSNGESDNGEEISFKEILAYNKPEYSYIVIGCVFSAIIGGIDPVLAVLLGNVLAVFSSCDTLEEQMSLVQLLGSMFFVLGVGSCISYIIESFSFAKSGMELVVRLRKDAFRALLRQDIAYFDDPHHGTGTLCARLATDAYKTKGATGIRIGTGIKVVCALGVAIGIGFGHSWQLALMMLVYIPLVIAAGFLQFWSHSGQAKPGQGDYEEAVNIATEAIYNIKTVSSLTYENEILKTFDASLKAPKRKARRQAVLAALAYGFAFAMPFIGNSIMFRFGIFLIGRSLIPFQHIFIVMLAIVYAGRAIGETGTYVPNYTEAKSSAQRVIKLLRSRPTIDAFSEDGLKPAHCKGEIAMQSIFFNYPSRPDDLILKDLTLSIKSGETLAVVGSSGSGKSTLVKLIDRFYDTEGGKLLVDGVDVKDLNVNWLRQQIGIVSQEPILFDRTIKDNILYGDCTRSYEDQEVIQAASSANIHSFIDSLPEKYATRVGKQGNQLSGGQKQRIAIARALLRNPKILLLDEATSALDAESEKIVQDTLDVARVGRSCVVVAHRLSTVMNSDQIAVIEDGRVKEIGTHDDLLAQRGSYYQLVNAQLIPKENETNSSDDL